MKSGKLKRHQYNLSKEIYFLEYVFRWENPSVFYLFILVIVAVIFVVAYNRFQRKQFAKAFQSRFYEFLTSSVSQQKRKWKWFLQAMVLLLLVVCWARPQSGKGEKKAKSEGIELMFLFDVSNSMLAEDVKPSRLEMGKTELEKFLDYGGGDRVGLVAFAGSGALLSPLTSDKAALKMFIDSLGPDSVSTQGTSFKEALQMAAEAFERGGKAEDKRGVVTRAIVIISDGEDNEKGAVDEAKALQKKGIFVYSIAVGTERGGAIPIRDKDGNLRGYHKDLENKVVLTKMKDNLLKELAQAGGGKFYYLTFAGNAMQNLRGDISKLQKKLFDSVLTTNYSEKYMWILGLALLFLFIEILLGERSANGRIWKGRFEVMRS